MLGDFCTVCQMYNGDTVSKREERERKDHLEEYFADGVEQFSLEAHFLFRILISQFLVSSRHSNTYSEVPDDTEYTRLYEVEAIRDR